MSNFVVSYLLKETHPDLHTRFKHEAMLVGFSDRTLDINMAGNWFFFTLPHTTVWGTFSNIQTAQGVFLSIQTRIPFITIERYIICQRDTYVAYSDRVFAGVPRTNEIVQCIAHQKAYP